MSLATHSRLMGILAIASGNDYEFGREFANVALWSGYLGICCECLKRCSDNAKPDCDPSASVDSRSDIVAYICVLSQVIDFMPAGCEESFRILEICTVEQLIEETLNESYFFWQLPAVYLPLVQTAVRDHTLHLQRRAFSEEAVAADSRQSLPDVSREPRLAVASAREGDGEAAGGGGGREVGDAAEISIMGELLFDCISVLSQTTRQLRRALHRSYLAYLESLLEPLALHSDPSGARLHAHGLAGLSFKPSARKGSSLLRFAATNCQVQQMVVTGPARKVSTPIEQLAFSRTHARVLQRRHYLTPQSCSQLLGRCGSSSQLLKRGDSNSSLGATSVIAASPRGSYNSEASISSGVRSHDVNRGSHTRESLRSSLTRLGR